MTHATIPARAVVGPVGCGASRRHRRAGTTLAACALAGLLVVGGCGGGDGSGDAAADIGLDARPATDRAGGDPEAVRAAVEALLRDHDRVVNQIVGDPGVANDPADPLVEEYTALFEPGSEAPDRALAAWAAQAARGRSTQPASPEHPAFASRLDGDVEAVGEGEVRFPTCDEQRYGIVDATGTPVQLQPHALVPGEGTAVLVDGRWRLRRLDVIAGADGCREGGT